MTDNNDKEVKSQKKALTVKLIGSFALVVFGGFVLMFKEPARNADEQKSARDRITALYAQNDSIFSACNRQSDSLSAKIKETYLIKDKKVADSTKQELLRQQFEILRAAREQTTKNWRSTQSIARRAGIVR